MPPEFSFKIKSITDPIGHDTFCIKYFDNQEWLSTVRKGFLFLLCEKIILEKSGAF